jgi:hypothetical protein
MKKAWLKIKQLIIGHMTKRAYENYRKWRNRLIHFEYAIDVELGGHYYESLSPERKEAIQKELEDMMDDLVQDPNQKLVPFWN